MEIDLKYNFKRANTNIDFNNAVKKLLKKIYENSYKKQVQNREIGYIDNESKSLVQAFLNLQEFIYYNFINSSDEEFIQIIWKLDKYLDKISIMPKTEKKGYGYYNPDEKLKTIYINPDISEERKKLYLAHELGHVLNRNWTENLQNYCENLIKNARPSAVVTFWQGFQFLDEVTTQDRAEDYFYWSLKKSRPSLKPSSYSSIKDNNSKPITFNTNFDYYGELQEPAILFARLVCRDCQGYSDEKILNELSKRALSATFISDIIAYFESIGKKEDFIELIYYMGLLKRGSYAKFSQDDKKYLENFYKNLQEFNVKVKFLIKYIEDNNGFKR